MPGDTSNEEKDLEMARSINSYTMEVGDKWYLVNIKWYRKWCEYIGYNEAGETTTSTSTASHGASSPEKIDNTPLFTDYTRTALRDEIVDDQDYKLLPEPVWKYIKEKYGVNTQSDIIERKVINDSQTNNSFARVEIKFPLIKCECIYDDRSTNLEFKDISRATHLPELVQKIRDRFQILPSKKVKLYMKTADLQVTNIDFEDPTKSKETFTTLGLGPDDKLSLVIQSENGSWPITTLENRPTSGTRAGASNRDISPVRSTMTTRSSRSNEYSYSSRYNESRPGLCGLSNLGNTCFMNSAIQCMSNVPILTHYFLSGKYKSEINTVNPLGRKGDFANAYAELIEEMWNGQNSYTVPRAFKTHISRFAPQFTGYQQQDSQELLAYMLDGLHEDLNRIKNKPYIESSDDAGKPDEQLAQESWDNYRKRNDSKIVDTFHGLIKSTLNCLECQEISIKFDPICYLSLPLPSKKERLIDIYYVALNQKEPLVKYKLNVFKNGTISDLLNVLSQYINVPKQQLIACDVYSNKFFHVYETHEPVSNIRERDDIYIYEMPYNINSDENIKFQFYLKEKMSSYSTYFGLPLMLAVPKNELSTDTIYKTIIQSLKRFIVNSDGIVDADVNEIHSKLNSASFFNDEDDDKSKKLCNLYLSKSDHYDYNNSNQVLDANSVNSLLKTPQNQIYTVIGEFSSKIKDTHYVSRINPIEHESCNAKLVAKKDILELDECFNLFTKKEELSDSDLWYCPKCKKHQHATKQIDLWSAAQVLVIHLKRFSYSRIFRDKIDTLVDFPIHDLELNKYIKDPKNKNQTKYNLIAISNHYGGLGGGHYTAYAQNCEDGNWYNFDDSSVSSMDESSVVTPAAYLLVYMRQDLHAKYLKKSLRTMSNGRQEEVMDTN